MPRSRRGQGTMDRCTTTRRRRLPRPRGGRGDRRTRAPRGGGRRAGHPRPARPCPPAGPAVLPHQAEPAPRRRPALRRGPRAGGLRRRPDGPAALPGHRPAVRGVRLRHRGHKIARPAAGRHAALPAPPPYPPTRCPSGPTTPSAPRSAPCSATTRNGPAGSSPTSGEPARTAAAPGGRRGSPPRRPGRCSACPRCRTGRPAPRAQPAPGARRAVSTPPGGSARAGRGPSPNPRAPGASATHPGPSWARRYGGCHTCERPKLPADLARGMRHPRGPLAWTSAPIKAMGKVS